MVPWAAAHLSEEFQVGDKSFDVIARRFDESRSAEKLEQRVSIFLFPVSGD